MSRGHDDVDGPNPASITLVVPCSTQQRDQQGDGHPPCPQGGGEQ